MTSVLNTSSSALLAFQRALSTVSHNVANINTDGYSRQTSDFATADPSKLGRSWQGNGSQITNVRRVADQLAITRLIGSNAEVSRLSTLSGLADRVDALLSDRTTNLEGAWSGFFDAVSGLASDASSTAQRQDTLDQATALVTRFHRLNGQMDSLNQEVNNGMITAAGEINRLTAAIADLNRSIGNNVNTASGDLLDRRDALANELIGFTGGTVNLQDGGMMNIITPGGTALVSGTTASKVSAIPDAFQPERLTLALTTSGLTTDLSSSNLGGSVGGMLEFRNTVLDPAQAEIGRIALGLTSAFNAQQSAGVDLYGNTGTDLFGIGEPKSLPSNRNTGSATLAVSIGDLSRLSGQNVRLAWNGNQWQATSTSTGEAVPMTGSGTTADPFVIDGMHVVVNGTPAAYDQFLLKPTAGMAGSLSTLITDPSRLAAAKAVQATTALGNTGSGTLSDLTVTDASHANLATVATVLFADDGTFSVDGGAAQTYTPGMTIAANGWSFVLDGQPRGGDTFTIRPTPPGSSDSGNALLLSAVEDLRQFTGGTQNLTDVMAGLTTKVGSAARNAEYSLEAATVIQQQAENSRDSVSGVNLDEEAAQMLKLQQAYQAASQMVATADTMFQTILGAVSR